MHDERIIAMLKQLFNGVIELRDEGNRRVFRYVSPSVRTEWKEFNIVNDKLEVLS